MHLPSGAFRPIDVMGYSAGTKKRQPNGNQQGLLCPEIKTG